MKISKISFRAVRVLLLFFATTLICTPTSSQTWEKYYMSEQDDYVNDALIINETEVVFAINKGVFDLPSGIYESKLVKLDLTTGEFTDSTDVTLQYNNFLLSGIIDLFLLNDSIIIAIGGCYNSNYDYTFYIAHYSLDLELLYEALVENFRSRYEIHLFSDSIFYLTGMHQQFIQFVEEIDIYGNLIRQQTYNFNAHLASNIFRTSEHYHMYLHFDTYHRYVLINLDDLTADTVLQYPQGFSPRNSIPGNETDYYYVAGRKSVLEIPNPPGPLNRNLAYLKVDQYGNIMEVNEYLTDSLNFYSIHSFSKNDEFIFLGGTQMLTWPSPYEFFMFPGPRWLLLYKLTHEGDVVWQKFYKGEVDYMMWKVLATPDGGALIFSTRYDWNDPIPNQRDVHILKVDSDGNYVVGIDEIKIETRQILVYPNPASDVLNFAFGLYNNLEISIFDNQGKLLHLNTYQQSANIDISHFKPGMYFYTIHGHNGFAESGKLIKQ
jgi:hypothetical protein